MKKIIALWKKVLRYLTVLLRTARAGVEKTPSIISRDCVGGAMYHDLKMQFLSPTINLYLEPGDFLNFVLHLEAYKTAELLETENAQKPFPVGVLRKEGLADVPVYFMHYRSFRQAREKWLQRFRRLDADNIVVVFQVLKEAQEDPSVLETFQRIPYKKIALVTDEYAHYPNTFAFTKEMFDPNGEENLLHYRKSNKLLQWRYLDYFDYGAFLKTGEIKKRKI